MREKILIFIDILGFEKRAIEIEDVLSIPAKKIRKDFLDTINDKIIKLKEKKIVNNYSYGRDDWIVVVDSLDQAFQAVSDILNHNVFYPNFEKIPLEIAIGTGKFDQWAKFDNENLIIEDSTIEFLKTKIIGSYHKWFKKNNDGNSPKSTFIILSESIFFALNTFDKKNCQKIDFDDCIFYFISNEKAIETALMVNFLIEIGYPKHTRYKVINELFVPPSEYKKMEKTLETERLLFIIGTQEYGKTFSAVRLLWEYYKKGYTPKWIRGGEDFERNMCRSLLENVSEILSPKSIIYFEDPFGKITYEKRENLEREIGTIINEIKRINDVFIIITSREEVYKEFEHEMIQIRALDRLKLIFSIKNNSYDDSKRTKILINWATLLSCKWLNQPAIKDEILNKVKNRLILPTPLSIWNFAVSTINISDRDILISILEEKSQETSLAFAKEIQKMSHDKILFLTYPFIADYRKEFVKKSYIEYISSHKISDASEFEHIFNWFVNDKIDLVGESIIFSHPSYWESFKTLLKNKKHITDDSNIKCILSIFSYLTEKKGSPAGGVAKFISHNFELLPEDFRNNLLRELAENKQAVRWVITSIICNYNALPDDIQSKIFKLYSINTAKTARLISQTIAENFYSLPQNIRDQLLLFLVTNDNAAPIIAEIVSNHFEELSQEFREQLLYKLFNGSIGKTYVPEIISKNYSIISQETRNLFFKLSENEETTGYVAESIVNNYELLPLNIKSLLFKLYRDPKASGMIAKSIVRNYEKLNENIQNILTLYAVDNHTAGIVATAIIENYEQLPKKVKNMLFTLLIDSNISDNLIEPIGNNYDNLPQEIKNVLIEKSERPELVKRIAKTIEDNFEKFSDQERFDLLLILASKHHSANRVAKIIANNFYVFPRDQIVQLILILSSDDYSAIVVAEIVKSHFKEFSKQDLEKLLLLLSNQESAKKEIGRIIIDNYHYLPDTIKKILFDLAQNKQDVNKIASVLANSYSNLPEKIALELLLKMADHETAYEGIAIIISNNFNKIPEKTRNELILKMSETLISATLLPEIIVVNYHNLPKEITSLLFKLSKFEGTAGAVAKSISINFSTLPNEVQNLLFPLASETNSGLVILKLIQKNFFRFPEKFRDKLLLTLSNNDVIAPKVAHILLKNYTKINSDMKTLLFELSKKEEIAVIIALAIMKNYDSNPKDIKNLLTTIMKEFNIEKIEDIKDNVNL